MLFSSENPTEINKRTQHSHFKWTHNTLVRMQSSALQGVNSKTTIQMISSSRGQGDNLLVEVPGSNRGRADDTCKFTRQYGTNTQKCSGGVYWPTRILFFFWQTAFSCLRSVVCVQLSAFSCLRSAVCVQLSVFSCLCQAVALGDEVGESGVVMVGAVQ